MLEICPVLSDDYADVAGFLAKFAGETRDQEFWLRRLAFWWDRNPAFSSETQRGWSLRDQGKIVGFFGVVASRFLLHGRETTVFATTTWRVPPEYGSESLKLFFKVLSAARSSLLFCTTPNKQVVQMLGPLKFRPLPNFYAGSTDATVLKSVLVIDARDVLRSKLSRLKNELILQVTARSVAPILQLLQHHRLKDSMPMDHITVTRRARADAAFDVLWEKTQQTYLNTNVRTAELVNWYCFDSGGIEKQLFGCYRDRQLIGYAIFWRKDRTRLKILECVDLWLDPGETAALASLVNFAGNYASEHGVDLVVFPHFTRPLRDHLTALGLLQMQLPRRREYLKTDTETYQAINGSQSYFVGFQGDYGL